MAGNLGRENIGSVHNSMVRARGAWSVLWLAVAVADGGSAKTAAVRRTPLSTAAGGVPQHTGSIRGARGARGLAETHVGAGGRTAADTSRRRAFRERRGLHDPTESLAPSPAPSAMPSPAPTALGHESSGKSENDGDAATNKNSTTFIIHITLFTAAFSVILAFIAGPCLVYGDCNRDPEDSSHLDGIAVKHRLALPGVLKEHHPKAAAPTIYDIIEEEKQSPGGAAKV